jgi:hypothetical protein
MSIVIEYGLGYMRVGCAGECAPRCCVASSLVALVSDAVTEGALGTMQGGDNDDVGARLRLACTRELYALFHSHLLVKPREWSVLLVEPLLAPTRLREALLYVLLKTFKVPSVSMQPDLHMPLLASGLSTGVVVHVGQDESMAIAFQDSRPVLSSLKMSPLGTRWAEAVFAAELTAAWGLGATPASKHCSSLFTAHVTARGACDVPRRGGEEGEEEVIVGPLSGSTTKAHTLTHALRRVPVARLLQGCRYTGAQAAEEAGREYVDTPTDSHGGDELGGLSGMLLACLEACSTDVRAAASRGGVVVCGPGAAIPGLGLALCAEATCQATAAAAATVGGGSAADAVAAGRGRDDGATGPSDHSTMAPVVAHLPGASLALAPCPFPAPLLVWVGGSLFAASPASADRFVRLQDARLPVLPDWLAVAPSAGKWAFQQGRGMPLSL